MTNAPADRAARKDRISCLRCGLRTTLTACDHTTLIDYDFDDWWMRCADADADADADGFATCAASLPRIRRNLLASRATRLRSEFSTVPTPPALPKSALRPPRPQ